MDEITKIAHKSGAVAIVDGREVWATVSGGVVQKLMREVAAAERGRCIRACNELADNAWSTGEVKFTEAVIAAIRALD